MFPVGQKKTVAGVKVVPIGSCFLIAFFRNLVSMRTDIKPLVSPPGEPLIHF
jgi:hypothetical protein